MRPCRGRLRLDHRHLGDVDRATAETAFAIHEVIAPELVERLAEALEIAAPDREIVAAAPAFQGLGIVQAEAFAVLPAETAFLRESRELRLVEKHAAGEDVGLDEVGIARISVEELVPNRDEL